MAYSIDKKDNSIVISGFEDGIADDPYSGISDIRNVDIITVPKEASVAMSTQVMTTQGAMVDAQFTVSPSTPISVGASTFGETKDGSFSNKNVTASIPAGTMLGDVMIAQLVLNGGTADGVGINTLSGWTLIHKGNPSTHSPYMGTYYRIAGASEPATYTWNVNGTNAVVLNITRIIGADSVSPLDTSSEQYNDTSSTTATGGTVTPSTPDSLILLYVGEISNGAVSGYTIANDDPTWTEQFDNFGTATGAAAGAMATAIRPEITATGNATATLASSSRSDVHVIVLKPSTTTSTLFTYDGVIPLEINTAITFSNSGGALPAGLSANTPYYIISTPTSTTFTISAISAGGVAKDVTDAGSGINTFSTIQMGTPGFYSSILITPSSNFNYYYFVQDSNGRDWVLDSDANGMGNTNKWVYMHNLSTEDPIGFNPANGIIAYKGYFFSFTPTEIDVISIIDFTTGSPNLAYMTTKTNWNRSWETLLTNTFDTISHQAIISQNDSDVYICNEQNIASISEIPGSLPSGVGYSFNIANTHTVADGVTTNGSPNISTVSDFFQATDVGAVITGIGLPDGATIATVIDATHATLSLNDATADGTAITFTITSAFDYTDKILPLPTNEIATCLTELGNNLMIGGINNYIYPWDRVSPNFFQPIFLAENYTYRMVTVNTNTYMFTGERGRIYVTNGSQAQIWKKLPDHISGTTNPFYAWKDAIFNRNQLYFGFSVINNTGDTINQYGGLWAIDVETKALRLINKLSYDTYNGFASALYSNRDRRFSTSPADHGYGLFIGWNDGSAGGIDQNVSTPYTGSQAIVISDLIPIGTFDRPTDFERVEYKLSRPLVSGESIQVYARIIFNTEDTGFGDPIIDDSGTGNFSKSDSVNFKNAQWLQLKAVISSTNTNPSYTRLTQLRIKSASV